jgi:hypothetical protein
LGELRKSFQIRITSALRLSGHSGRSGIPEQPPVRFQAGSLPEVVSFTPRPSDVQFELDLAAAQAMRPVVDRTLTMDGIVEAPATRHRLQAAQHPVARELSATA